MFRILTLAVLLSGCLAAVAEGDLPDGGDRCGGCASGLTCEQLPDCHPELAGCVYRCVSQPTPGNAAACATDADCHQSHPDVCNLCTAPLNVLVCAASTCQCACQVH
jgi:hypothetical protein